MDIQYNRSEGYSTVVVPTSTPNDTCEYQAEAKNTAKLCLDDHKYIETSVIFMPNIWTLMPNNVEYQKIVDQYKTFIDDPNYIPPNFLKTSSSNEPSTHGQTSMDSQEKQTASQSGLNTSELKALTNIYFLYLPLPVLLLMYFLLEFFFKRRSLVCFKILPVFFSFRLILKTSQQTNDDESLNNSMTIDEGQNFEPTHYSKLDIKKMKVRMDPVQVLGRSE